jgi:SAM-dependent methyltransferase
LKAVSEAAAALRREWAGRGRPVLIDVGSGGGWAARYLPGADVIGIDLLDAEARPGEMRVRGDMRRLPIRDATVDAAFYAASLHYAPIEDSIREAARVLRPGGLLIAIDSPMYRDARAQARARERSARYYAGAGFPELAAHYHPIDVAALRGALAQARFEVVRLDAGRMSWIRRASILIARYP